MFGRTRGWFQVYVYVWSWLAFSAVLAAYLVVSGGGSFRYHFCVVLGVISASHVGVVYG